MNHMNKNLNRSEILLCLAFFFFSFYWAIIQPYNSAPDEPMRYAVAQFLFQHNRLPVGDELISHWGFSYAHYPTVIYSQIAYVFMKIVSLFTTEEMMLVYATRMVSVVCGTGTVYFSIKASKRLFPSLARWIFLFFIAAMPQFVFLSSYVNCDSVAIFSTSVIFYSWVLGMTEGWNYKNAALLAMGISICALAYYNSYAWILFSIPFFLVSSSVQNKNNHAKTIKLAAYTAAIVLLLISYSFIRHLVLYNDLLGFRTCTYYGELYAIDSLKPSIRASFAESGIPLSAMLFDPDYSWFVCSWRSFIGTFGYMAYILPKKVYWIVTAIVLLPFLALMIKFFIRGIKRYRTDRVQVCFFFCLAAISVTTVLLSIIQSYYRDFQPQGRYCYPAMIPLAFAVAKGYEFLLSKFDKKYCCIAVSGFCITMVCLLLVAFHTAFLPSIQ